METYFITAKTVEEAYAEANRKYADDKHEVSCEVVEMPKKGFLGIGAKNAKIKVTVTTSASAELGSIVADMRKMKTYSDRGGDGRKNSPREGKQNNGEQKKNDNRQNKEKQNNKQNGQNKPQNRPQQKAAPVENKPEKPVEKQEKKNNNQANANQQKPVQKSALRNQAKQNVRQQIKHVDSDISSASITVSKPMGLTDFVADDKKNSFGNGERKSSGSMSNDIRKKKPAAKQQISADKVDAKIRSSKYDMAESDDDYKAIESMERENEVLLEKEATEALGFAPENVPAEEPKKREPITQIEMDYALEFANTLLKNMNLEARAVPCKCPEGEEFVPSGDANVYPMIEIVGDDTGILIGHHGETLDAIQYLVNLSSLRKTKSKDGDYVKIVVDIENYRAKRSETLKTLARRMAAKAVKYKRNVFLEPMNAYERRIIHSELQNYEGVSTHSVGSDRDRKIVITYEGPDKQPQRSGKSSGQGQSGSHSRRRRSGHKRSKHENEGESYEPVSAELIQALNEEKKQPKKVQKVPFENLSDILEGGSFIDGNIGDNN